VGRRSEVSVIRRTEKLVLTIVPAEANTTRRP
jgi:hypothetical protein